MAQATLREQMLMLMVAYSEEFRAAGWYPGLDDEVRTDKGIWLVMAFVCGGWPRGNRGEDGWAPLTEEEIIEARSMMRDG